MTAEAKHTPEAFAADIEALVAKYGQKLNDNEVITALEGQLSRAWEDACEPQPKGLWAAAPGLLAIAGELEGAIDEQTYDERRRADFDMPDDAELCVMITVKQFRALSAAIAKATQP